MKKTDIKLDKRNYNKHSDENKRVINKSLNELGAGRSILLDSEDEIIAGNGVYEQAEKLNIPIRIIETDGSELIAVKRTDLKTDDEKRKKLALVDNHSSSYLDLDTNLIIEDFNKDFLNSINYKLNEVNEFIEKFNNIKNVDAEYPLVPEYEEHHEAFIIISDNEIDSNWLREKLNMQKMKSYKSSEISKSNVISIHDLKYVL